MNATDGASNRIDEARGYLLAARKALAALEADLTLVESNIGQPSNSRIPALDRAARSALGVDIACDELARATCWLTREYRERERTRASMSRPVAERPEAGGGGSTPGSGPADQEHGPAAVEAKAPGNRRRVADPAWQSSRRTA